MLIIRTYALYGRSRRILALTVGAAVAEVIFALVNVVMIVTPESSPDVLTVPHNVFRSGPFYLDILKANVGQNIMLFPLAYFPFLELRMSTTLMSSFILL